MSNFQISHSQIPSDIIYHISCDGQLYIGQSKQGFARIQSHINESFRHKQEINENYDSTGATRIYSAMCIHGLSDTIITYYPAEEDYGLQTSDIDYWLSIFIPANANAETWSVDQATPQQRRDAAEILHILYCYYSNKKLTNVSFGGQSTSWRMRLDDSVTKLLTRQTSPADAARLISASDMSLKNLFNVFNQTNNYLFTDKWSTIYNPKIAQENKIDNKLLSLTWPDFVNQYVCKMIVTGIKVKGKSKIVYEWDEKDTELIKSFLGAKIDYLKAVTPIIGDKKAEPTAAHKRLLNKDTQHLFSAVISIENAMAYVTNALQRGLENVVFSGKNKWSGSVSSSKKTFKVVNVTGLFNISKMHTKGNIISDFIQNLKINEGHALSDSLKKEFAFAQFQYIYQRIKKIAFPPNTFFEFATEDTEIVKHSQDGIGFPVVSMSSRYITNEERLTNRVRLEISSLNWKFAVNSWEEYFRDMMHIYRKHNKVLQQLYELEDNHGNTLYSTQSDIDQNNPYIYYNDPYHSELEIDLNSITIY